MADNKFLDDIAKFGNSTITAMNGIQRQVRKWAGEKVEELIQNMDLVKRSEINMLKSQIETLEKKVAELEKKPAVKAEPKAQVTAAAKPKTPKAPAAAKRLKAK